jgi:UDP-glucose 4-epimerase
MFQGTLKVLEASRSTGIKKIVYASSVAIYGPQAGLITEESPIFPNLSLYGATKLLGESLLECYHRIYSIPFIALRYGGVYGPGEVRSSGMAEVTKKIESTILGKDVIIEDVGGEEQRNFTFVKDAAQATVKALFMEKNIHKVFNITGGEDNYITSNEFHRMIKKLFPSAGEAIFKGKGPDQGKLDISLARRELGYRPEYSLERGIQEDIDFFLSPKK